jgi:glyoxylase-like metal-dependent hydrolase (beta-lactamase superfamily II)
VDTGFTAAVAAKRKREFLRTPKDALSLLGVSADAVREVVITQMHYDHVGTFFDFPQAVFHLQDEEIRFATGRHMRQLRFAPSSRLTTSEGWRYVTRSLLRVGSILGRTCKSSTPS